MPENTEIKCGDSVECDYYYLSSVSEVKKCTIRGTVIVTSAGTGHFCIEYFESETNGIVRRGFQKDQVRLCSSHDHQRLLERSGNVVWY